MIENVVIVVLLLIIFIFVAILLKNRKFPLLKFGGYDEKAKEIDNKNYNILVNKFYKLYPRKKLYGLKLFDQNTQYIKKGIVRNNNFIGHKIDLFNDLMNMDDKEVYLEGPYMLLQVKNITLFGEIHNKFTLFDQHVEKSKRSKFVQSKFYSILDLFSYNKSRVNIFMESSETRMKNTNSRMEYLEEILSNTNYFKMDIRNRDGTDYVSFSDEKFDYNKLLRCIFENGTCKYGNKYDKLIYILKDSYKKSSLYKNKRIPIIMAELYNIYSEFIEIYDKITIFSSMCDIYTIFNLFTRKNIKKKKTWIYAGSAHIYFIYLFLSLYYNLPYKNFSYKYKTYCIIDKNDLP